MLLFATLDGLLRPWVGRGKSRSVERGKSGLHSNNVYRGYDRYPQVGLNRSTFGGYVPAREAWAASTCGRISYGGADATMLCRPDGFSVHLPLRRRAPTNPGKPSARQ